MISKGSPFNGSPITHDGRLRDSPSDSGRACRDPQPKMGGYDLATALASRLDPEDVREIIGAYHRCCNERITKAGGNPGNS